MRWLERLVATAVLSMSIALAGVGASYGQDKVVRIGFQKYGKLVLLKSKGTLEEKLKAAGYRVVWTEFPSGPPLLEALNVGAIDFGNTGEARRHATLALKLSTGRDLQYFAALAFAYTRDDTRAKALADDLDKRFPEDTIVQFNYLPSVHGKLALN